ncbi:hypothetical protein [Kineococcus sp. SYSU DK005]
MPQRYPAEVRERAGRLVLDRQGDYRSLRAASVAMSVMSWTSAPTVVPTC